MNLALRYALGSCAAGAAWGGVAGLVAASHLGRIAWGGVYAGPLAGLAVGFATQRWCLLGRPLRIAAALVVLYSGAALFGLGVGVYDWMAFGVANRIPSGVVGQAVLAVLWGLTFTGWFLAFWPLSYATLAILGRISPRNPVARG